MAYKISQTDLPGMDSINTMVLQNTDTHIPGNHETSEACPLVDAGRDGRKWKEVQIDPK